MSGINVKAMLLRRARGRFMQPFWEALAHVSILGRNFWATHLAHSGELNVLHDLKRRLGAGVIVFDVGANAGDYSVEAVSALEPRKVYAFEPSQAAFKQLSSTIESRGLQGLVTPIQFAMGSAAGSATLHTSQPGATVASLVPVRDAYQPFVAEHDEQVQVTTLDEFCATEEIDRIGLLKVDVEGLELAVLQGANTLIQAKAIDAIQFEFGEGHIDARTYMRDFFDLLSADYDIYRIVADGARHLPRYTSELEVFACVNYLALLKSAGQFT